MANNIDNRQKAVAIGVPQHEKNAHAGTRHAGCVDRFVVRRIAELC